MARSPRVDRNWFVFCTLLFMPLSPDSRPPPSNQLLEALNTAVLLLDESLLLVYLNPAAENLFEISRRQVLGHYLPDIVRADAAAVSRLQDAMRAQRSFTERELALYTATTGQRMTVD